MEFQKEKERREIVMKELLVRSFTIMYIHFFFTLLPVYDSLKSVVIKFVYFLDVSRYFLKIFKFIKYLNG